MPTTTFTMRLDEETKKALEAEAKRRDRSAAYIAKQAITDLLEREAYKREAIEEAIKEADTGVFISGKVVMGWMDRWADGHDEPMPKPDIFPEGYRQKPGR